MSNPLRPSAAIDRETRQRLDRAFNEILAFGMTNLPDRWEIRVYMNGDNFGGSAWITLFDPDGNARSEDWEGDALNVWDMVDYANEWHRKGPDDGEDE